MLKQENDMNKYYMVRPVLSRLLYFVSVHLIQLTDARFYNGVNSFELTNAHNQIMVKNCLYNNLLTRKLCTNISNSFFTTDTKYSNFKYSDDGTFKVSRFKRFEGCYVFYSLTPRGKFGSAVEQFDVSHDNKYVSIHPFIFEHYEHALKLCCIITYFYKGHYSNGIMDSIFK